MPFTGGTYTGLSNSFNNAVQGTVIEPDDWNDLFTDIEAGINAASGGIGSFAKTDVASASTCNIGAATTPVVRITGTTTITSFGTVANSRKYVYFAASLTLTHNATSLILPLGLDMAVSAGDSFIAVSDVSGNWRIFAANTAVVRASSLQATTTPYNVDPTSGYFSDYEGLAAAEFILNQAEVQAADENGGFRSAISIEHQDSDTTNYSSIPYRTISDGLRVGAFGAQSAGTYVSQYKDIVGVTAAAVGRIEWTDRGVSAITAEAIQYGTGIASNEFLVSNPSAASAQSLSMAALQGIVSGKKGASDSTHKVRGVLVQNVGKLATSAFEAASNGTGGDSGQWDYLLNGELATVATAAIRMPLSGTGDVGTRILYDTDDFTSYDRASNIFTWVIGGSGELALSTGTLYPVANDGLSLGDAGLGFSDLYLASGAVINFNSGDVNVTHSANALAFSGASSGYSFDAVVRPASNDGAALGSGTTAFSDLYLASGGIINWNNADVNITHSLNGLAFSGASSGYTFDATIAPAANDGAALGSGTTAFSDLFLATGGVVNFNNGDVTVTHSADALAFAGAASGYTFSHAVTPAANDGAALGASALSWSDVFVASGGVINWANGDATLTHSTGLLTANVPIVAGSFRPSSSSVPSNGMYLPAANTLGWAVNSGAEMQLTSSALSPAVSDGSALGTSSLMWSDLFLASGGVINFNNSDVTITHSADALSFGGALSYTLAGTGGDVGLIVESQASGAATARFYAATSPLAAYNGFHSFNGTNEHWYIGGAGIENSLIIRTNGAVERLRVTSAGELLIGTTTDNGAYLLQVNSQIFATNATVATSDARLKTDIEDLSGALQHVKKLRARTFRYRQDVGRDFGPDVLNTGFIAQELLQDIGDAAYVNSVVAECGEFYGVAYEKLVPVLVAALQEVSAEVDALKATLAAATPN